MIQHLEDFGMFGAIVRFGRPILESHFGLRGVLALEIHFGDLVDIDLFHFPIVRPNMLSPFESKPV
jgi:hypothetical protein